MSNINFNLNTGKEDFTSLKEAIFKRAREKAEALNSDVKNGYTSDIKNDIMESARISVRNNPFLNLIEEKEEITTTEVEEKPEIKHSRDYYPERPKRQAPSRINNQLYAAAVRDSAMREASETLRQNQNVMRCLTFLNTQAAIALNKPFVSKEIELAPKEITFGV